MLIVERGKFETKNDANSGERVETVRSTLARNASSRGDAPRMADCRLRTQWNDPQSTTYNVKRQVCPPSAHKARAGLGTILLLFSPRIHL